MRSHKMPSRTTNRPISQTYNDGMITIYDVEDVASVGHMPREQLTTRYVMPYDEQRVGITRYYTAQQAHKQVEKVVRIQRVPFVSTQQKARLHGGAEYRIDQVQTVEDVFPPSLDLTLVVVESSDGAGGAGSEDDGVDMG